MSELLKVSVERIEKSNSVIITVMDIKDDSENIRMIDDEQKMCQKAPDLTYFMMGLLVDGSDGYNLEIADFLKEYKRELYRVENETLDGFDEDREYRFTEAENPIYDEIVEHFIESTEMVELKPNEFWKNYVGGDYDEEELPYVKVKVTLKEEKWAEKFDGGWWTTAFDITQ